MLRYLHVVLVGTLFALAAFAAGIDTDLPTIVQVVLVACMALFLGALMAGVADAASSGKRVPRISDRE